jgi:hypothetical protein
MRHFTAFFIAFFVGLSGFSQSKMETTSPTKRIELGLQFGIPNQESVRFFDEAFRSIVPGFPASDSLSTFESFYDFSNYNPVSSALRLSYNLKPFNKKSTLSSAFSLNLGTGAQLFQSQSWENTRTFTYDTLISQDTGEKYPLDSSISTGYNRMISSHFISIGIGYHLVQQINQRFSLNYGIVGMYQIQNQSFVSTSQFYYGSTNFSMDGSGNEASTTQFFTTNNGPKIRSATFSLPIEFRMLLAVRPSFWNHWMLGINIQPYAHVFQCEKQLDRTLAITGGASVTFRF